MRREMRVILHKMTTCLLRVQSRRGRDRLVITCAVGRVEESMRHKRREIINYLLIGGTIPLCRKYTTICP